MSDDRLLTDADVARILNVPKSWVEEHAREGHIEHHQFGRYRRYSMEQVEEFKARCLSGAVVTRRKIRAA